MGFSNSSLVTYTNLSPNYNPRNQATITKITIHHMATKWTAKRCVDSFANVSRQASSNYCIGYDGEIGMAVEEKNRSWCSGSPWNDHRAVTIECSNDEIGGNWHVSDATVQSCIKLCIDICQRNGIKALTFDGTKNGSLTWHCFYQATACPGPYLKSITNYIVEKVNEGLGGGPGPGPEPPTPTTNPYKKPTKPVNYGAKGEYVKWVQWQLNTYGYNLIVDGIYGNATQSSVSDFQKKHGLNVTGNCDTNTITKLDGGEVPSSWIYNGIDYCHTFDPLYYSSRYPDLQNAFHGDAKKLFDHYIKHGISEMRQAKATFDVRVYAARYEDLRKAFGALNSKTTKKYVDHYNVYGFKEGRIGV